MMRSIKRVMNTLGMPAASTNTRTGIMTCLAAWVLAAGIGLAADYEFYAGSQYPGKERRPGVELRKVVEPGGKPQEYARRSVEWWPRKGVDLIEVKAGMPLRTWTFAKDGTTLDAHLVGFRGMGNTVTEREGEGEEPPVVLRLTDGRKRMYPRGTFSKADKEFIMGLFVAEMERIREQSEKVRYTKPARIDSEFPNIAKPGEPGTLQVESEHFVWGSGSQSGGDGDPWINDRDLAKGERYRAATVSWAEYMWSLYDYSGLLMPYWDKPSQSKYVITVPGTKRDGHKVIGGYAGGGYGGCGIKGASSGLLSHEWGHGIRLNGQHVGGGEAGADTCSTFSYPGPKGNHHPNRPARNIFNGMNGYGFTTFYNLVGDDPNMGYGWFMAMPLAAIENNSLLSTARILEQRGLAKNGIRGLGDLVGEYAARLATFDCEMEDLYRRSMYSPMRQWLETVDAEQGIYRVPADDAPEPFGMNIVRLVPAAGATNITVDFRGMHNPETYSDWRACILAVSADGTRRYTRLWNKGKMTLAINKDDASHWLTVAATPTALYVPGSRQDGGDGLFYSGRHAWRYPWSAQISGATPGSPHKTVSDFGRAGTPSQNRLLPAPLDSPMADEAARGDGHRHANGGGWVQASATVDPTAYVGPNAMVLDNAKVLGGASVEDFAVVMDSAVVKDNARVFGGALITNKAKVEGFARTWLPLDGENIATVVPKRPKAEELHRYGLWANYAMDCGDPVVLEDFYRYPISASEGYAKPLLPVLDGYVYGQPEFVDEGGRLGLRFDGKARFAELSPRALDLGEATIVVELQREGASPAVVFDFGCSSDNCMTLSIDRDGTPRFVATVDGKAVLTLAGEGQVPMAAWAQLRVEIDGTNATLWVDSRKVAGSASLFRPCDVFKPDQPRRNLLACSRDGTCAFAGIIDSVVIYHAVHQDFDALPAPTSDAPVRPTPAILAMQEKILGDADQLKRKISSLVGEKFKEYEKLAQESKARREELVTRYKPLLEARKELEEARNRSKKLKGSQVAEFNIKVIAPLEIKVNEAETEAWKPYLPEKEWLNAFEFAGFRGYYNEPYRRYLEMRVRAVLGGGEMREDLNRLKLLVEVGSKPEYWRSEIDWDWRMKEEVSGEIDSLPLMQKWVLRTRGPVVKRDPSAGGRQ